MDMSVDEFLSLIRNSNNPREIIIPKLRVLRVLMDESDEELRKRLGNSSDKFETETAEWVLWRRHLYTSFANLVQIIHASSDKQKIREAAIVLGECGYAEAVIPLIGLLQETENSNIRDGAALGLRELCDQRALSPLTEAIKKDPKNAGTLVYALENLDCREIVEFLIDLFLMQAHDYMARCYILECIGKTSLSNLSEELVTACVQKLQRSVTSESDEEYVRHARKLESLLRA